MDAGTGVIAPLAEHRAARHPRVMVAVLGLAGILIYAQQSVVLPLAPLLPGLFDVDAATASWVVTSTLLVGAMATPIFSRLGDMFGQRRMVIVSLGCLCLGALLSALSSSIGWLILGRVVSGGALGTMPLALSLLRHHLPARDLGRGVAMMGGTSAVGIAAGPVLAGLTGDFHATFWALTALATVCIGLVAWWTPPSPPGRRVPVDVVGAVLLTTLILCTLLPLTMGNEWGWSAPRTIGPAVLVVACLALWIPWERSRRDPFIDLRLNARRPVLLSHAAGFFCGFAMFGNALLTSTILQAPRDTGYGFGFDVLHTGLVFIAGAVTMIVAAPLASRLLERAGARVTFAAGAVVIATFYLLRLAVDQHLGVLLATFSLVYLGTALALAALALLAMEHAPRAQTGEVLGVQQVVRLVGQSGSSCLIGAAAGWFTVSAGGAEHPAWTAVVVCSIVLASSALISIGCVAAIGPGDSQRPRHTGARAQMRRQTAVMEGASHGTT
jgi:MFS family permease